MRHIIQVQLDDREQTLIENLLKQYAKTCQKMKESAETEAENHLYDERHQIALRTLAKIEGGY